MLPLEPQVGRVLRVVYRRDFDSNAGILAGGSKVLMFHPPPCPPLDARAAFVRETGHLSPDALPISYGDQWIRTRIHFRAASAQ